MEDVVDFSKKTSSPAGINSINYFLGTLDGQGYIIKNLAINSPLQYVGIIGYSKGSTIKNVVLDSSSIVTGLITPLHHT